MAIEMMVEGIVEKNYEIDARRCSKIINLKTGNVFNRNLDPSANWSIQYKNAKLNRDEFECEYDKDVVEHDDDGNIIFSEQELRNMSMGKLQKIGRGVGVTGRSKDEIIPRILKKQSISLQ